MATVLLAVVVCSSCDGQGEHTEAETTFSPETTLSSVEMTKILFVLTDDQDPESLTRMENIQRLLVRQVTSFENASATTPLCCPRRV